MTINLTPTQMVVGLGVIVALLFVTRVGARRGRAAANGARVGAVLVSFAGRVLGAAGLMVGVQWIVITHPGNLTLLLVVLALPDLITAYVLTRALTVTAMDGLPGRWDGWRWTALLSSSGTGAASGRRDVRPRGRQRRPELQAAVTVHPCAAHAACPGGNRRIASSGGHPAQVRYRSQIHPEIVWRRSLTWSIIAARAVTGSSSVGRKGVSWWPT